MADASTLDAYLDRLDLEQARDQWTALGNKSSSTKVGFLRRQIREHVIATQAGTPPKPRVRRGFQPAPMAEV